MSLMTFMNKIMFKRQLLDVRSQKTQIMRDINKMTRTVTANQRAINQYKQSATNAIKSNWSIFGNGIAGQSMAMGMASDEFKCLFTSDGQTDWQAIQNDTSGTMRARYEKFAQIEAQMRADAQQMMQFQLSQLESEIEARTEMEVDALKDEQQDLETIKAGLDEQEQNLSAEIQELDKMSQDDNKSMWG